MSESHDQNNEISNPLNLSEKCSCKNMFKKYQTLFGQLCVFQTDFANLSSNDRSVTLGKLLFYHFDGKI